MKKDFLFFIPARSGSKSIINKNLQVINGLSLVERAIKVASKVSSLSQVVISSDSELILEKGRKNKINIHLRSTKNSSDNASTEDAILEFLGEIQNTYKWVVLIEPTSPFLSIDDIDKLLNISLSTSSECIYSVAKIRHTEHFLNQRSFKEDSDKLSFLFPLEREKNRLKQKKINTYKFGNVSAIRVDSIKSGGKFFAENSETFEVSYLRSINIDSEEELVLARSLASSNPSLFNL